MTAKPGLGPGGEMMRGVICQKSGWELRVCAHLVLGVVPALAGQVKVLPATRVNVRIDPTIQDQLHAVVGHFFATACMVQCLSAHSDAK